MALAANAVALPSASAVDAKMIRNSCDASVADSVLQGLAWFLARILRLCLWQALPYRADAIFNAANRECDHA